MPENTTSTPKDQALVNTFRTLGIKSLRVGAAAVDNPKNSVPQEKDIDSLFDFARAAGVKVIYSFRLKQGDPAESARLAAYIAAHDAEALDCYSIGNEPNAYDKTFESYFADWKPHYDAILKAVPQAMFDGPSVFAADKNLFPEKLADAMVPAGHMAMISDHYYVMGNGPAAEKNLAGNRAHFLSNDSDTRFEKAYAAVGSKLMTKGIPYRIDELNNCFHGGAKGISDTYTASLWALDATHWWAAHHILGLNYHTGEWVGPDGSFSAQNYSAFLHQTGGKGLEIRPPSYGYLAFTQGALGRPLKVAVATTSEHSFTAYAYRADDGSVYVTLINKTFADKAEPLSVSLQLPRGISAMGARRMDLAQSNNDITAQTDITLGGAPIDPQGLWTGHWDAAGDRVNPKSDHQGGTRLRCHRSLSQLEITPCVARLFVEFQHLLDRRARLSPLAQRARQELILFEHDREILRTPAILPPQPQRLRQRLAQGTECKRLAHNQVHPFRLLSGAAHQVPEPSEQNYRLPRVNLLDLRRKHGRRLPRALPGP